jgi:lipoprotein-anchoring transpeptidase ErfK/SrfK
MMLGVGVAAKVRRRRAGLPVVAGILLVTVTGCTSASSPSASSGAKASAEASASAAASAAAVPKPVIGLSGAKLASYSKPLKIAVKAGSFDSVQVSTKSGDHALDGSVSGDGRSWVSETPPRPGSTYQAVASVKDGAGQLRSMKVSFKSAAVPDNKRVAFTVTPNDGAKVGIGQPVVVRFVTPITKKAAIQKAMTVTATSPNGKAVKGSWSWLNSQEVDWKPDKFWTPGTKVSLDMKIAGVKASNDRYGRKDYSEKFTIGASHITRGDAASHKIKVYRDGKLVHTWPTGTGRRGLETYSGTYVVLNKSQVVKMDSCSARITCDKKDPDYYDENEYWATRITASGTFLHAAGWDGLLGRANVSHGCIHLSDKDAKEFYQHAVPGDVVIVTNSGRGPQERITTQDPGLYDWNLPKAKWKAGSAL